MQAATEEYTWTEVVPRPETRTKTERVVEYTTEQRTREIPYTTMVPETRSRTVPIREVRQEQRTREVPYTVQVPQARRRGPFRSPSSPHRSMRTREVPYTVNVPQTQSRTVRVTDQRQEQRTREVPFTVMVPQQRSRTRADYGKRARAADPGSALHGDGSPDADRNACMLTDSRQEQRTRESALHGDGAPGPLTGSSRRW